MQAASFSLATDASRMHPDVVTRRQTNLLGALVTALGDRIQAATEDGAGRGGRAPAALAILAQQEGLGIEGLRQQLDLSQPATVRLVDGLVRDGLAARRAGSSGRTITLELTDAGRARAEQVLAARAGAIDAALRSLSTLQRLELEQLLEAMLGGLTADAVEADVLCRLCDLETCPAARCPVNRAVGA